MNKNRLQFLSAIFLFCFSFNTGKAQNIITTIATNLSLPEGCDVDKSGTVYVADAEANRIVTIDTLGNKTNVAGTGYDGYGGDGGAAVNAYLNGPWDVKVDSFGNYYIADDFNYRVRMVNTQGIITTIAGNGQYEFAGNGEFADSASFRTIQGVGFDYSGNFYVADGSDRELRLIHHDTVYDFAGTGVAGYSGDGGPCTDALFQVLNRVKVDLRTGNIYIADAASDIIRKINPQSIISTFAGAPGFGYSGDGQPAVSAIMNSTADMALDRFGNLYIADAGNHVIRKVDTAGIISTFAGNGIIGYSGDHGPALNAELGEPSGIAVDYDGNIYISDGYNKNVRKISIGACNADFALWADSLVTGLYHGTNLSNGSNLTYLWEFGDGDSSALPYPSHTYASAGQYDICLTINNQAGCVSTYCDSAYIDFSPDTTLIKQLNVNGQNPTAIAKTPNAAVAFRIYPNPANNQVTINTGESLAGGKLTVTDITGRVITETQIVEPTSTLNTSAFACGVYFISANKDGVKMARKLVVSR